MTDIERTKRRIGLFLILLCPLLVFVVLPRSPDLSPGHRGHALVNAAEWAPLSLAGEIPYQWTGADTLIVKRQDGPYIVNLAKHTSVLATGVLRALRMHPELGIISKTGPRDWCASPNGQWLVTASVSPFHGTPVLYPFSTEGSFIFTSLQGRWVVVKADGSRLITFPAMMRTNTDVVWTPDSRAMMACQAEGEGSRVTYFPITPGGRPTTVQLPRQPRSSLMPGVPLGVIGKHKLLIGAWGHSLRLTTVDLDHWKPDTYHWRIEPPGNALISEVELSPRGTRLAWVLDFPRTSASGLREIVPFLHALPGHTAGEIWVSQLDGGEMHPLVTGDVIGDPLVSPHFVRWCPDGKNITFVYHDTLYKASAL